jgi:hypothetical protein
VRLLTFEAGHPKLRWTWLPYWLGSNARLRQELESELRDIMLLTGRTEEQADALEAILLRRIQARFPALDGLLAVLRSYQSVLEPIQQTEAVRR